VGRGPIVSFASFQYQAAGWTRARRVVAKVEWHQGELYPRVGFVVTNMTRPNKRVVKFYNGRGTAEQWIREGKNALRFQLAEVAVPRALFAEILRRIDGLRLRPPPLPAWASRAMNHSNSMGREVRP
jgi:hypothetical protein